MQETGYLSRTFPAGLSPFCGWEIPARKTSILLRLSVVDWLGGEIGGRPAHREHGGILLGRVEDQDARQFTIEGFVPLPGDEDEVWRLSPPERRKADETLRQWCRGPGKNLYSIGLYRSHKRDALEADAEDVRLVAQLFPGMPCLLLLVKLEAYQSTGALFVVDDGSPGAVPDLVFPFKRQTLAAREAGPAGDEPAPGAAGAGNRLPAGEAGSDRAGSVAPPPQRPKRSRVIPALIVALSILISAGLIVFRAPKDPPAAPVVERSRGLELQTESDGRFLTVTWNRDAAILSAATAGILSIGGSGMRRDLELDAVQLRSGRYSLRFAGASPAVSLHVLAGEREASESIGRWRNLAPALIGLKEPPGDAADSASPRATGGPPGGSPRGRPVEARPRSVRHSRVPDRKPGRAAGSPVRRPMPPSRADVRSHTARPETAPETVKTTAAPEARPAPEMPSAGSAAGLPAASGPAPAANPSSSPGRPAGNSPAYLPPLPIRRVMPSFPRDMKHWIGSGIVVNIRVYVNNVGKVVRAEPVVRGGPQLERLSMIAANAALEWNFAPARRGDRNVESETVLHFRFAPDE